MSMLCRLPEIKPLDSNSLKASKVYLLWRISWSLWDSDKFLFQELWVWGHWRPFVSRQKITIPPTYLEQTRLVLLLLPQVGFLPVISRHPPPLHHHGNHVTSWQGPIDCIKAEDQPQFGMTHLLHVCKCGNDRFLICVLWLFGKSSVKPVNMTAVLTWATFTLQPIRE